jgi:hypothetical protein
MRTGFICALIMVTALVGMASASDAGSRARYAPHLKNCRRYNGPWGFYGNIWCTPAEQRRWDRYH